VIQIIHRRGPWRSFDAVEFYTLGWLNWINNRRRLKLMGLGITRKAAWVRIPAKMNTDSGRT